MFAKSKPKNGRYQTATKPGDGEKAYEPKNGRQVHEHYRLKRVMRELGLRGLRVIDRRWAVGKESQRWRAAVVAALGGDDAITAQQEAVLDAAEVSRLMLRHIDSWLAVQPSIINKRRKALIPIVQQRMALADGLLRQLQAVGLERRTRDLDLHDLLAEDAAKHRGPE